MTDSNYFQKEYEKLSLAYQEALQTNRIKTGFLGRIAHEIRSPLGSIMGLHQLIINNLCDSPEEERESVKQAYEYTQKLMAMIDQLIEVSKLEVGKINLDIQEFNLWELLEDIHNIICLEAANKNLKILLENQAQNQLIKTDKLRLTNVLFYLLEVAIDVSTSQSISVTLSSNQNNQIFLLSISFFSDNFSLQKPEPMQSSDIPVEQIKRLHTSPEFSTPMKIMLTEALLEIMDGSLWLKQSMNEGKQFKELCLSLPVEIQPPNH